MRLAALAGLVVLAGCQTPATSGAACARASDCAAPLTCSLGRCRPQCVQNRDCPIGSTCVVLAAGGACTLDDDPGCGPSAPCPSELACIDRACANPCTTVAECPSDALCSPGSDGRARCVRAPEGDGGASDADVPLDADCHGPACDPVEEIFAGAAYACARTVHDEVWCWGGPYNGQETLDPCGPESCTALPARLGAIHGDATRGPLVAERMSVGRDNACAISTGEVVCWGAGWTNLLGVTSVPIGAPARAVQLESGGALPATATDVLVSGDAVISIHPSREYGWGPNQHHELGADAAMHELAVPVSVVRGLTGLTAGEHFACGLMGTSVLCWGDDSYGELGDTTPAGMLAGSSTPIAVPGLPTTMEEVRAGRHHACALDRDSGAVWCWGRMAGVVPPVGCVPLAAGSACPAQAVARATGVRFTHLGTSIESTQCALDAQGSVWCWGDGVPGISGDTREPVRLGTQTGVREVAVGLFFTCMLQGSDVYCLGQNEVGQLGQGSFDTVPHPDPLLVRWR